MFAISQDISQVLFRNYLNKDKKTQWVAISQNISQVLFRNYLNKDKKKQWVGGSSDPWRKKIWLKTLFQHSKKRRATGAYLTNKECDFLPGTRRHLGIVLHDLKIGWTCGKDDEILSLPDAERQNLTASEAEKRHTEQPHLICHQQFGLSFLSK